MNARLASLAFAAGSVFTACSGNGTPATEPGITPGASTEQPATPSPARPTPTTNPEANIIRAFQAEWPNTDFSNRTVNLAEVRQGCPGADCIPALDAEAEGAVSIAGPRGAVARFSPVADLDYQGQLPVAAIEVNGDARAYPLHILTFHEIVNDIVGGEHVAVTFCPLCNTAISFERTVNGDILDFGVSGMLRNSDLIMFDRQTESWWQQATGESIAGEMAGTHLEFVATRIMSFADFTDQHPDGLALTENTGINTSYGRNPYVGYDSSERPFLFSGDIDERLPALERVVGLDSGETPVAVPFSVLSDVRVANVDLDGETIAVFWAPGTVSALDGSSIAESDDVGTGAAYVAEADGMTLTFAADTEDGTFRDMETGSTWNVSGRAIAGPLEGTDLPVARHANHFWFAFAAFYPSAEIWRS